MLNWNEQGNYKLIIDVLRNDEIVLAESDTVLGLFAQLSEKAKKMLDTVKQRNLKPYILLIKSADLLERFTDQKIDAEMQRIISRYWPGPLTIIFKAKADLPDWMTSAQKTIAIRIPHHQGLQSILREVDALFTTSANISDQNIPHTYEQVNPAILEQVGIVCCDDKIVYDGPASTIIDCSSGSIKILRSGIITIDSI